MPRDSSMAKLRELWDGITTDGDGGGGVSRNGEGGDAQSPGGRAVAEPAARAAAHAVGGSGTPIGMTPQEHWDSKGPGALNSTDD